MSEILKWSPLENHSQIFPYSLVLLMYIMLCVI